MIQFTRLALASAMAVALPATADQPAPGAAGTYEVEFLKFVIDHHFSALRMTELAAGTDTQRSAELSPNEGTSPTLGFAATPAKGSLEDLKSLARRNNRMQREEIQTLRGFLRDWYGFDYQPRIRRSGKALIEALEQAKPGADFNRTFYQAFSRHHYTLLEPVNGCVTGAGLHHEMLRDECRQMWHSQTSDIQTMRRELQVHFGIADFQPFPPLEPLASGGRGDGPH